MDNNQPFMRSNRTLEIVLLGLGTIVGLFFASRYNYLLFHTLAEIFSITVAGVMFVLAWNTWKLTEHDYLKFLGVAFLFIGGIDLVHTLAYKGMGLFPGYDANLSTQLWIAARYVQALTLLIAPAFLHRKLHKRERYLLAGSYAALIVTLLALIFARIFPDCYIEGQGLTRFKIVSEYIISLLIAGAIWRLIRHREAFTSDIFRWLVAAMGFTIISELAFTFYVSVYGLSNLIGHIFKIFAFYSIYRAIVETGLRKPYALIFRDLKQSEELYHQMFADHSAAMLLIDPETGAIIEANPAAEQYYGYSPGTLQQMTVDEINTLPPEEVAKARREVVARKRTHFFFQHRLASGELRDVEVNSVPIQVDEQTLLYSIIHDITERKRAEETLRKSEAELSAIVESSPFVMMILDREWRVQKIKDKNHRFIENPPSDVLGCRCGEAICCTHADDVPEGCGFSPLCEECPLRQAVLDTIETGKSHHAVEVPMTFAHQEVFEEKVLLVYTTPLELADERQALVILQDITERKRAEDALKRVRYSIDRVIDSVFWVDENGNFIDVNDAACRNLGYKREELLTMGVSDIDPNFPREAWSTHWKEMLRCGTLVVDSIHQTKSGRQFPVEVIVHNQQFGDKRYNCVLARDITERKRAEEALRVKEDAIATSINAISMANLQGHLTYVNDAFLRLWGYDDKQDVLDRSVIEFWQSPDQATDLVEALKTSGGWRGELKAIRKDGVVVDVQLTASLTRDKKGKPVCMMASFLDVTERKRAEKALRESEERFRTIVNALPQFIAYTDKNLVYRFVNRTYQQKFNLTPAEVIGKSLPEVIGEEAFEKTRPYIEKALQGEQVRYHERYDYTIGGTRDIDGILVPDVAEGGEVRGYYAVLTDITPYMEIQEELRQYTGRLRILHEIDTAILHAQSPREIAIAALGRLHQIIPCRHTSVSEIDSRQSRGRDMIIIVDGELRARKSNWRPLSNAGPELIEAIRQGQPHVVRDIAALETLSPLEQMLETAGLRSYVSMPLLVQDAPVGTLNLACEKPDFFQPEHIDILEGIAASLAVALQQAQLLEQTKQDAETKALLLREVNHRVKNNLDAIIGLLYVERRHAPPEALPAYRSIMDDLTQRITGLAEVHQMLTGVEWAPLNLSELAERIIHITVRSYKDDLSVTLDVAPSPVRVNPAQAQHLALILSELTTNTLKYGTNGREAVRIAVQITQKDDIIKFIYRNDGPGYPEDVLRLDRHGTGLDIVKRSVRKNLRGELILRNDGGGAVTEIRFKAQNRE
jgi:PAS domain S-box-containing protein